MGRLTATQWIAGLSGVVIAVFLAVTPGLHAQVFASGPRCEPFKAARPADVYVPMDSWVYSAMARLHALGYADTAFLGVRPWTRRSIERMLDEIDDEENVDTGSQAAEIVAAVRRKVGSEDDSEPKGASEWLYGCEQVYARPQGIGGLTLRDEFPPGADACE